MTEHSVRSAAGVADPSLYDPRLVLGSVSAEELSGVVQPVQILMKAFDDKIPKRVVGYAHTFDSADVVTLGAISPLVSRALMGEEIPREEIAPHSREILGGAKFFPGLRGLLEKNFTGAVRGVVASPATHRHVEKGLAEAAPFAEILAGYENPREQLRTELATVTTHMTQTARRRRAEQNGTWTGDWSRLGRDIDKQVTAEDAAYAIDDTLKAVLGLTDYGPQYLPMVRRLTAAALARAGKTPDQAYAKVRKDLLPLVAIDVIEVMQDALTWDQQKHNGDLIASVRRTTPALRQFADMVPGLKGKLNAIHQAGPGLLRHLPGILPERSDEVRAILPRLHRLLLSSDKAVSN